MTKQSTQNDLTLFLTLVKDTFHHPYNSTQTPLHHGFEKAVGAIWLQAGSIDINGATLNAGAGVDLAWTDNVTTATVGPVVALRFIVSSNSPEKPTQLSDAYHCDVIFSQKVHVQSHTLSFRLDQVDFPVSAIAYRHTHPGPGIRYLVNGGLTLQSDHEEQIVKPGDTWFEDANSPVIATAINTEPSRFIRAMLLPLEYEGRSTFTLQNPTDADKPRLQTNIRHCEKRINIEELL